MKTFRQHIQNNSLRDNATSYFSAMKKANTLKAPETMSYLSCDANVEKNYSFLTGPQAPTLSKK